ncbi:MAG: helix-turn-helix domain-containing protein [Candidatus Binataceae bacterium]
MKKQRRTKRLDPPIGSNESGWNEALGPPIGISAFSYRLGLVVAREFRSAAEFAKAAGVSPHAVSHWLRGRREPSRDNLVKLAAAAKVSVGWLAAGEGKTRPSLLPPEGFRLPAGPAPHLAFSVELWRQLSDGVHGVPWLGRVKDDAMEPTLHNGDFILYEPLESDPTAVANPNGIYFLEGWEIRRIEWRVTEQVGVISCDNPAYHASTRILPFKKIHLKGKILWRAGRI